MNELNIQPTDILSLSKLASDMYAAELKVATADAELRIAKEELARIAEREIPELMERIGMEEFTTSSGIKVRIKQSVSASVPVDRREDAWKWLDENGHGAIVKRTVAVAFNKDQEEEARKLLSELREEFASAKEERKVEPATLSAWAKKRLEEGDEVPECITVFRKRAAEIKAKPSESGPF